MNGGTGLRFVRALAVTAAAAVLTAGCGVVHVHFGSSGGPASRAPGTYQEDLAYARCMRSHGVPQFPLPRASGTSSFTRHLGGNPDSPAARANAACEHLLSAGPEATASPSGGAVSADCLTSQQPCYTPQQLRAAYGIQPLLDRGITGRGVTVVLLEFPPLAAAGTQVPPAATDIRQDLARFDSAFGLPAARLQVVNSLAHAASPWLASTEEVADTEIVHAIAPGAAIRAAIREVLIPAAYTDSLGAVNAAALAALRLGLAQGGVVSFSGGAGEQCFSPAQAAEWNSELRLAGRAARPGDRGRLGQ
jgi:uncharacterized protein YceK